MAIHRSSILILASLLGGCASLPNIGPTGDQIQSSIAQQSEQPDQQPIAIVHVDDVRKLPQQVAEEISSPLRSDQGMPTLNAVGIGDVLSITVYEAGVSLFGNAVAVPGAANDLSVKAHELPPIRVDERGNIDVPYVGSLHVQGQSSFQIERMVRDGLAGKSADPQVVVNRAETIGNSVIVGGAVNKPGRVVLTTNTERLSDVMALAGGEKGDAKDLALRVTRGEKMVKLRLADVFRDPDEDYQVIPGDRLTVIADPLTYSVLGASGRIDLVPFSRATMSLAEAIAKAGGVNPNSGDPGAIFLFRQEINADGSPKPVVYHFNMMQSSSYFLAQRFTMRDSDILYFATAKANQPSRMIQLVSQLFAPIATVTNSIAIIGNN